MSLTNQILKSRRATMFLAILLAGNSILVGFSNHQIQVLPALAAESTKSEEPVPIAAAETSVAGLIVLNPHSQAEPIVPQSSDPPPLSATKPPEPNNSPAPSPPQNQSVQLKASVSPSSSEPSKTTGETSSPLVPATNLIITNPKSTGGIIHFAVNERIYSLSPGESTELTAGNSWKVRFHSGMGDEEVNLLVKPGKHHFQVGINGWRLESAARQSHP